MRIVRLDVEKWQHVPLAEQERIFGRRKVSGAPMYALDRDASDLLDPVYTNDPQGLITPLNCHIRLANPQTPQTAATSAILRRSYEYQASPGIGGHPDVGHAFCCFQRELDTRQRIRPGIGAQYPNQQDRRHRPGGEAPHRCLCLCRC